mgnify:CR=1 FL=1
MQFTRFYEIFCGIEKPGFDRLNDFECVWRGHGSSPRLTGMDADMA